MRPASKDPSFRALHDLDQAPALGPREGTGLTHDHGVADVGVVALVVSVQRPRGADDLLVTAMAPRDVDPHGDRLLSTIRDHHALAGLRPAGLVLARRRRGGIPLALARLRARPLTLRTAKLRLAPALRLPLLLALFSAAGLARRRRRSARGTRTAAALLGG